MGGDWLWKALCECLRVPRSMFGMAEETQRDRNDAKFKMQRGCE